MEEPLGVINRRDFLGKFASTICSVVLSGCIADSEVDPYNTPQVKFAEWFVENDVMYFGAPGWCPPCRLFQYDLTPEGWEILSKKNFVECSEYVDDPFAQECIDAQVPAIPAYKAPWEEELFIGYRGLGLLAKDLGYPYAADLDDSGSPGLQEQGYCPVQQFK